MAGIGLDSSDSGQDKRQAAATHGTKASGSVKCKNFVTYVSNY